MPQQPNQKKYGVMSYISTKEMKLLPKQQMQLINKEEQCFAFVLQQKVKVAIVKQEQQTTQNGVGGELFLIPPHCKCTLLNEGSQQAEIVIIHFRSESLSLGGLEEAAITKTLPYRDGTGLKMLRMPQARSWIKDFQSDSDTSDASLYYQLQSQLYAMVAALIRSDQNRGKNETDLTGYVEQVKQLMIEQLSSPINMEELAKSSGVSATRFYQAFRSYTGLTPLKYITKLRLDASMRMLSETSSSIVDVAHAVGYPDEYYFSRLFKRQMGLAPTEYARLARKRVATLVSVFTGDLSAIGMPVCLSINRMSNLQQGKVLQQLREAKPDLILSGMLDEEMYAAYSAIAPVLMLDWKTYSWKERLIKISDALGLSTAAERWLSDYEMKVQNARAQIYNNLGNEPILIVHAVEAGFRIYGPHHRKMKDIFYDDLQMTYPESAQEIGFLDTNSLREIADLGCSSVLFLVSVDVSRDYCKQLEERWCRLWQSDQRGRCLFISYHDRLKYNPIVHEGLIDETVRYLMSKAH